MSKKHKNPQANYDDLTVIKGIGGARQRWLREQMQVRTLDDLAALTAEDIESLLRAEGQIVSRGVIENWLEEAHQFAIARATSNEPVPTPETQSMSADWEPAASFVVEFQTRAAEGDSREYRTTAHHIETDTGAAWDGIVPDVLSEWMRDQLQDLPELLAFTAEPLSEWGDVDGTDAEQTEDQAQARIEDVSESDIIGESTPIESPEIEIAEAAPVLAFSDRLQRLLERTNAVVPVAPEPRAAGQMPTAGFSPHLRTLLEKVESDTATRRLDSPALSTPPAELKTADFSSRLRELLTKYGD